MSKSDLVLLAEATGNIKEMKLHDDFQVVVNSEPPRAFVKDHPMATGVKYVPIDKIELMLDKIFQQWYVEVIDSGQLLNSIFVTVRLYFLHPVSQQWQHQDGVGAATIQVDKGENASNLSAVKSNAIMLALPAAKSYAIKDAAEHIGKLFGRDLNRKDTMAFTPSYGTPEVVSEMDAKKQQLKDRLSKAREAKQARKQSNAGNSPKQENRHAGVDGNASPEDNGQDQQTNQAPEQG